MKRGFNPVVNEAESIDFFDIVEMLNKASLHQQLEERFHRYIKNPNKKRSKPAWMPIGLALFFNDFNLAIKLTEELFQVKIKSDDELLALWRELKKYEGMSIWGFLAHCDRLELLLRAVEEKLFNPNEKDSNCPTIWHIMAQNGCLEALKYAMNKNLFDPMMKDHNDLTVWQNLAFSRQYEVLKQAIDEELLDPALKNNEGATICHVLAVESNFRVLKQIIQEGLVKDFEFKIKFREEIWSHLYDNVFSKKSEDAPLKEINEIEKICDIIFMMKRKTLLEIGQCIPIMAAHADFSLSLLFRKITAIKKEDVTSGLLHDTLLSCIKRIVKNKSFSMNVLSAKNKEQLLSIGLKDDEEFLNFFEVTTKKEKTKKEFFWSYLSSENKVKLTKYVYDGDLSALKKFVARGKKNHDDVISMKITLSRSFLHLAVLHQKSEIVKYFCELGMDIAAVDKNKETPLHYAAKWETQGKKFCKDTFLALLEFENALEVMKNKPNGDGKTAFDLIGQNQDREKFLQCIQEKEIGNCSQSLSVLRLTPAPL